MLTDDEIKAQVLAAFQEEQAEHRQAIGELLLELERSPAHPKRQALLDQLFREAHSLKGGARAAGQPAIEQVAHLVEDLFSAVRQDRLALSSDICDPIYAALDAIGALMRHVAAGQPADLAPYQPLLGRARPDSRRSRGVACPWYSKMGILAEHRTGLPRADSCGDGRAAAGNGQDAAELPPFFIQSEEQAVVRLATATLDQLLTRPASCSPARSPRGHARATWLPWPTAIGLASHLAPDSAWLCPVTACTPRSSRSSTTWRMRGVRRNARPAVAAPSRQDGETVPCSMP